MPMYDDYGFDNYNYGYEMYDDWGSFSDDPIDPWGGGCFPPDEWGGGGGGMPPDTPAPPPQPNPNLFEGSYWWSQFTDITNPNPFPMGPMSQQDFYQNLINESLFYGINPLDYPIPIEFRGGIEAQVGEYFYNQNVQQAFAESRFAEQANEVIRGSVDQANNELNEISDPAQKAVRAEQLKAELNRLSAVMQASLDRGQITDQNFRQILTDFFSTSSLFQNNTGLANSLSDYRQAINQDQNQMTATGQMTANVENKLANVINTLKTMIPGLSTENAQQMANSLAYANNGSTATNTIIPAGSGSYYYDPSTGNGGLTGQVNIPIANNNNLATGIIGTSLTSLIPLNQIASNNLSPIGNILGNVSINDTDIPVSNIDLLDAPDVTKLYEYVLRRQLRDALNYFGKNLSNEDFEKVLAEFMKHAKMTTYDANGRKVVVDNMYLVNILAQRSKNPDSSTWIKNATVSEDFLKNILNSLGIDFNSIPQGWTVDIGIGVGTNATTQNSGGNGTGRITPQQYVNMGMGVGGVGLTLASGGSLVEGTAAELFAAGAIGAELLAMIPVALAGIAAGAGYAIIFSKIIDIVKLKALDEAHKTALAAEIAILHQEVIRKIALVDAAAAKIAEIQILTSSANNPTDYANPPRTKDWTIPGENELPKGELVPTGGRGVDPEPPNEEEPETTPPSSPNPSPNPPGNDFDKILKLIADKLGVDLNKVIRLLAATLGGFTVGTTAVNVLRKPDIPTLSPNDEQGIADLASYRQTKNMPPSASDPETGTLATVIVDGGKFRGHSVSLERQYFNDFDNGLLRQSLLTEMQSAGYLLDENGQPLPYGTFGDPLFVTHAEAEALLEAKKSLGSLEGKELTMYVDRACCDWCYKNLPILIALWGIKKITIITSGETTNGNTLNKEIIIFTNQKKQ